MSTVERTVRAVPPARGGLLERVAVRLLTGALAGLDQGTLVARLPDGTERTFGSGPAQTMEISDTSRLIRRLATRGTVGLGESYQAGEWTSPDVVGLLELLYRNAEAAVARHPRLARVMKARPRPNRRQGLLHARRNIEYHYDLGNDLFRLMLDETMTYSCAVFERENEPLAEAQRRKLRRVCDKLELGPDDHLLEIGCGWGSFALTAAGEYGARVTGLTLSPAQAELARERIRQAGLDDRIRILEEDYRVHRGSYTKLASIEMIEAIGEKQFPVFFDACDRLLASGGRGCVQTILIPDHRWDRYRRSPDWIERYVFPGCLIPSHAALERAAEAASRVRVTGAEEIGPHYAETLRRWRATFLARLDDVRRLGYDEHFVRTWDFYLAACEAGFRTGALRDAQLVLER
ncbi:MAG TPA: cyclopropane-fatty-acyl-phospholipid synthase family protein [Gaiellaceae bacterium]|nr:cyclopropane-fatty-acyl-phospholipid synthase family protein [Gaiellaceae bacterium]